MSTARPAAAPAMPVALPRPGDLTALAEARRRQALALLEPGTKSALGQFMTPAPVAEFMAGLFAPVPTAEVRLLDPGAGVGALTAAFVQWIQSTDRPPDRVTVDAYELDPMLAGLLRETLRDCERTLTAVGIEFEYAAIEQDFIEQSTLLLRTPLWDRPSPYTHVITNPPYKKIPSVSPHRRRLSAAGIQVSNLYAAFVSLAVRLLAPGGELVAITPRSFCNGPYFRPFRKLLLAEAGIDRVHSFEARNAAFRDDEVLQENVIYHAVKEGRPDTVELSLSQGVDLKHRRARTVSAADVVRPGDADLVIHLPALETDADVAAQVRALASSLPDLGLSVSTGPVVDFRLRPHILTLPQSGAVPLIYPAHFNGGTVTWPRSDIRKPNAIDQNPLTRRWLMPNGCYVLTKRFTSKEERRRIVAVVFDGGAIPAEWVGFENHVNVYHQQGHGLPVEQAWGLATYLNSGVVDRYFRSFNGHTQVNAGDLRALRYPCRATLCALGRRAMAGGAMDQDAIDSVVGEVVFDSCGHSPDVPA